MMKVRVAEIGEGLHPSEIVVGVQTKEGQQNLVVDKRSLLNGYLRVGFPIRQEGDDFFVELPRETVSGAWRVWVNKSELQNESKQAA